MHSRVIPLIVVSYSYESSLLNDLITTKIENRASVASSHMLVKNRQVLEYWRLTNID